MTTGKIITLTRWAFFGKVMPLLFNMLSRFVIVFLPYVHTLRVSQISPLLYLVSCPLLMSYSETTGSGGHSVDATRNLLV